MHAAIVISGAYRTLPDCNTSIVRHVIDANPEVKFHVYAHLTTETASGEEHSVLEHSVWSSFPCVVGAALEANADVSAGVRAEVPGVDGLPRGRGTAQGKAMNIVKMFRGISIAQQLLQAGGRHAVRGKSWEELKRAAGQGGDSRCPSSGGGPPHAPKGGYDLVIRLRPDLCFCGPLDLKPMLARAGSAHLWLPWWSSKVSSKVGWAFDQIAVGSPHVMAAYASAYETTVPKLVAAREELYPEAVMWAHLTTLGPHARLLRQMRSFPASLARSSPRLHFVDPYSKIKQDMAVVRPADVAGLPAYSCHADLPSNHRDKQSSSHHTPTHGTNRSGQLRGKRREGRRRRVRRLK